MIDGLEAITTKALGLALDAASMRQQAIAANIANANSVGYAPLTVNFEAQLADARRALESQGRLDAASLAGVQPRLDTLGLDASGRPAKVLLDVEVAELSRNAVQYQTLVKALNRHLALLSDAIGEGKK